MDESEGWGHRISVGVVESGSPINKRVVLYGVEHHQWD
jgi:hypothetical protein